MSVDPIVVASVALVELFTRPTGIAPVRTSAGVGSPAVPVLATTAVASTAPTEASVTNTAPPASQSAIDAGTLVAASPARPEPNLDEATNGVHDGPPATRDADADAYRDDDTTDAAGGESYDTAALAADLVPLMSAARNARDELAHEGCTVSRDALARRLRRNGHSIRNNRVSELLSALRREAPLVNGSRPHLPV